jgi:nucleoid-associated protein YgaU
VVPGDAPPGQLVFSLLGSRSQAMATAALEVIASDVPVQVPPQAPFSCDLTDGPDAPQVVGVVEGPPAVSAPLPSPNANALVSPSPSPVAKKTGPAANGGATPNASSTPSADPSAKADAQASPSANLKATPTPLAAAKASATPQKKAAAAAPSPVPTPPAAAAPAPATPEGTTYTVQVNDTLPSIAAQIYGDASKWTAIYDANRSTIGEDPNVLPAGAQLTIPAKES